MPHSSLPHLPVGCFSVFVLSAICYLHTKIVTTLSGVLLRRGSSSVLVLEKLSCVGLSRNFRRQARVPKCEKKFCPFVELMACPLRGSQYPRHGSQLQLLKNYAKYVIFPSLSRILPTVTLKLVFPLRG